MTPIEPCVSCGEPGELREDLPMPVFACASCLTAAQAQPFERDPAAPAQLSKRPADPEETHTRRHVEQESDASPRPRRAGSSCRNCGAAGQWFKTLRGTSILMEPGVFVASEIPQRQRWEITHGDTAALMQVFPESGHCRVCHFDVCPSRVSDHGPENARLRQLWK